MDDPVVLAPCADAPRWSSLYTRWVSCSRAFSSPLHQASKSWVKSSDSGAMPAFKNSLPSIWRRKLTHHFFDCYHLKLPFPYIVPPGSLLLGIRNVKARPPLARTVSTTCFLSALPGGQDDAREAYPHHSSTNELRGKSRDHAHPFGHGIAAVGDGTHLDAAIPRSTSHDLRCRTCRRRLDPEARRSQHGSSRCAVFG
jgi:hypothetical protein